MYPKEARNKDPPIHYILKAQNQPRPQGASKAREKRPGDEVGAK